MKGCDDFHGVLQTAVATKCGKCGIAPLAIPGHDPPAEITNVLYFVMLKSILDRTEVISKVNKF